MANYSTYFAIEKKLKQTGFDLDRKELLLMFTDNKKQSLTQLSPNDYREFILWLDKKFPENVAPNFEPKPKQFANVMEELREQSMNKIASQAKETSYGKSLIEQSIDSDENLKKDKMRKKIIAMFCKMGYKTSELKADMVKINNWVKIYGELKVGMNDYSIKDLAKLVSQLEIVMKKYLLELNKPKL
jgi:hypothetical protein